MQPIPPPRRATTLPTQGTLYSNGNPSAAPSAATPAALAHHRSLVAYFWHYAQQGYVAPLTAPEDTDERRRQEAARTEAVEWARQCGIPVVDPGLIPVASGAVVQPALGPGATLPAVTSGANPSFCTPAAYPTTSATPYPVAQPFAPPSQPFQTHGATSSQAPIPPISNSLPATRSAANAPSSFPTAPTSESAGRPLPAPGRRISTRSRETPPSSSRARPLPQPPPPTAPVPAALFNALAGMKLGDDASLRHKTSPRPTDAIAPSPPTTLTSSPSTAAVPTFSFSVEADVHEAVSLPSQQPAPSAPAVPTISFGLVGDDDNDEEGDADHARPVPPPSRYSRDPIPKPVESRRAAPLHPRFDPSHPSHRLYHPTSVMSPLSTPAQDDHARPGAGTIACSECGQLIFGRVLFALGRKWHPDCFRCAEAGCGARLEVMEFEGTPDDWDAGRGAAEADEGGDELRGKAWCMVHFEERFALECHHCHTPIASADYIPISDPALPPAPNYRHPSVRYYHPLHFFCAGCGDPFIDPVQYESCAIPAAATSAEGREGGAGDLEAKPYFAHENHPYCDRCDLRMWRPKCPGCRKGLREEDGFLELPAEEGGGKWHDGCFKCSLCEKSLTDVYMIRRVTVDAEDSQSATKASRKDGEETATEEVALAFCLECFDRTEETL
ncbi:hypothetical protein JCM3774_003646 [Rhodotorula dairenensis]